MQLAHQQQQHSVDALVTGEQQATNTSHSSHTSVRMPVAAGGDPPRTHTRTSTQSPYTACRIICKSPRTHA
jgi:hypothetical protein